MKNFIYRKAATLEEAFEFLLQYKEKARILAGGTDLLVKMKKGLLEPEILIDIKGISSLDGIRYSEKEALFIGSLVSIRDLEVSSVIQKKYKVISEAAGLLGSIQIRNLATLGGNLCNASPAAEMVPCLMTLGARLKIKSSAGERMIPLENFLIGPGQTELKNGEILMGIQVPNVPQRMGCVYMKHTIRKAMDLAIISVAASLTLDPAQQRCQEIKIVLGAAAPIPLRARKAEGRLRGERIDKAGIREASEIASREARPITDVRGSAEYRKEMVRVFTEKSVQQALNFALATGR